MRLNTDNCTTTCRQTYETDNIPLDDIFPMDRTNTALQSKRRKILHLFELGNDPTAIAEMTGIKQSVIDEVLEKCIQL